MRKFKCYGVFCQFNNRGYCEHPEWHDENVVDGVSGCGFMDYFLKKIAAILLPLFVRVTFLFIAVSA